MAPKTLPTRVEIKRGSKSAVIAGLMASLLLAIIALYFWGEHLASREARTEVL